MIKLLRMGFVPGSVDAGLLILRVWLGGTMLLHHGLEKLTHFRATASQFPDLIGVGPTVSVGLSVFAEFFCAALLVLGLFTRFAALVLSIQMAAAFFLFHLMVLSGPKSGELPFIYLAGFVTLFLAGAGRISLDGTAR